MRTCISPDGKFVFGIHKPAYSVRTLRSRTRVEKLGVDRRGAPVTNESNYPSGTVEVEQADWIFEIANPLPFRGTTYIGRGWADHSAENPERIKLPDQPDVSLHRWFDNQQLEPKLIDSLPRPLLLALAVTSTDPVDLILLARKSCRFEFGEDDPPLGLCYSEGPDKNPEILDYDLFEAVANNKHLPDDYKIAMVIRPGAQGSSEIVGDYHDSETTHIYEYLRTNSYIGGGHYAANMADDAIRYQIDLLTDSDIIGLRHLYYQRSYIRLADFLAIELPGQSMTAAQLEDLRHNIVNHCNYRQTDMAATLWGWNFGFDFSPSGYRLHASHQQIHQQYAMIPARIEGYAGGSTNGFADYRPFSSGDMIEEVIAAYRDIYGSSFFHDYLRAIFANTRMDSRSDLDSNLVVWEDEQVVLFVPKAQTSQWELQLMTKPDQDGNFAGNIVEASGHMRRSLDLGLLKAQKVLAKRGASMVTTIEYSKRFSSKLNDQPLIYCLMPKLPQSMGAFSEAQLRFINGHYPEDFAAVCRRSLNELG